MKFGEISVISFWDSAILKDRNLEKCTIPALPIRWCIPKSNPQFMLSWSFNWIWSSIKFCESSSSRVPKDLCHVQAKTDLRTDIFKNQSNCIQGLLKRIKPLKKAGKFSRF